MNRLLMLTHRLPYPPDKGERVRAYEILRALSAHFSIVLGCLSESGRQATDSAQSLAPFCQTIVAPQRHALGLIRGACALAAGRSVTEGYFASGRLARHVFAEGRRQPFDLVLAYSSSMLPLALRVPARRHMADICDVDSAKWQRYADDSGAPLSWLYRREAAGVARLERKAVERCDAVLLISQAELDALGIADDRLHVVGNGVDAMYFNPATADACHGHTTTGHNTDGCLVFTGTMNYRPNIDGVCWFVQHIWPAIRRLRPACRLMIVGREPAAAVRRLAAFEGVEVTGAVPDVRPYLRRADLAIAPLRIARGVQNKVLEAMAMACPVVASSAALEGLDVEPDHHVMQADSPQQWVRIIDFLLAEPASRQALGQAARQRVVQRYSWATQMEPLVQLCRRLLTTRDADTLPPPRPAGFITRPFRTIAAAAPARRKERV